MKNLKVTYQEIVNHLLQTNRIILKIADEFTSFEIEDCDYYLIVFKSKNNGFYINYQMGLDCGLESQFVLDANKNSLCNKILDVYYNNLNILVLKDVFDLNKRCEIAIELIKTSIAEASRISFDAFDYVSKYKNGMPDHKQKQISPQDVIDVANNLGMTLDIHQVNFVLQNYDDFNTTDLWSEIIENLLYQYEYHQANIEPKN
jgi:hypothetical protein